MAPRRTSRTVEPDFIEQSDPIDSVTLGDKEQQADELTTILDSLQGLVTAESRLSIHKVTDKGAYEWIKTVNPPFDPDALFKELQDEWGGGLYSLTIRAKNAAGKDRIVSNKRFSIAGDPNPKKPTIAFTGQGGDNKDLVMLMLNKGDQSSAQAMQMMTMMMNAQQQASDRQMQMLVPLLSRGSDTPALLASIAPLLAPVLTALLTKEKGGGFGEIVEVIKAVKELNGGGDSGEDTSFLGLAKAALPALGDAVKAITANAGNATPQPGPMPAPPQPGFRPPMPMIANHPAANFAPNPSPLAGANPTPQPSPVTSTDPILSLIGRDVLFYAQRQLTPEFAADAVLEILEREQVPQDALFGLVVRFQSSQDWLADLASEGIDLRPWRGWAEQFLAALVAGYTEDHEQDQTPAGEGGGDDDVTGDVVT